jgi:hypothetical protein
MAGYFRARYQFFGAHFRAADVRFVATRLEVNEAEVQPHAYHKQTVARHPQIVLEFLATADSTATAVAFCCGNWPSWRALT